MHCATYRDEGAPTRPLFTGIAKYFFCFCIPYSAHYEGSASKHHQTFRHLFQFTCLELFGAGTEYSPKYFPLSKASLLSPISVQLACSWSQLLLCKQNVSFQCFPGDNSNTTSWKTLQDFSKNAPATLM